MDWLKQHKFLFIGLVVAIIAVVGYGVSNKSAPAPLLTTVTPGSTGSPTEESADQQLVTTLLTLRAVTLSGTIFQDPAFTTLRDFGTPIVAEPIGRQNPFAPLGGSIAPTPTSQTR